MKKIFIILFIFSSLFLFSQDKKEDLKKVKFKKLKSNVEIKETVVIRKPDVTNILRRKETTEVYDLKVDIKEKIRNSNKLLY